MKNPARGEIWTVDLNPQRGREQSGIRPALVLSVNRFNESLADLVIAIPITAKKKGIPLHVKIEPPEGGLKLESFIKCEDIRSISKERLIQNVGTVSQNTLNEVENKIRLLLGL
ncbi:MAG: type II toxin-antitoxin system PemK/MazF family toxin [Ignavibacteriales bacterium]|nr:type II toxin-antitoxin system PemK/MazF family toxin [Ignavibacteriales bacterium]